MISWPCNIRFTAVVSLVSAIATPDGGVCMHVCDIYMHTDELAQQQTFDCYTRMPSASCLCASLVGHRPAAALRALRSQHTNCIGGGRDLGMPPLPRSAASAGLASGHLSSESACLCRPARRPSRPRCNTHTPCMAMCTRTPSGMCFPGAVSSWAVTWTPRNAPASSLPASSMRFARA